MIIKSHGGSKVPISSKRKDQLISRENPARWVISWQLIPDPVHAQLAITDKEGFNLYPIANYLSGKRLLNSQSYERTQAHQVPMVAQAHDKNFSKSQYWFLKCCCLSLQFTLFGPGLHRILFSSNWQTAVLLNLLQTQMVRSYQGRPLQLPRRDQSPGCLKCNTPLSTPQKVDAFTSKRQRPPKKSKRFPRSAFNRQRKTTTTTTTTKPRAVFFGICISQHLSSSDSKSPPPAVKSYSKYQNERNWTPRGV